MWRDEYVFEKLRELEAERLERIAIPTAEPKLHASAASTGKGLRPLVRLTGKVLRRAGEGLESWAAMHQADQQEFESRRAAGRG